MLCFINRHIIECAVVLYCIRLYRQKMFFLKWGHSVCKLIILYLVASKLPLPQVYVSELCVYVKALHNTE